MIIDPPNESLVSWVEPNHYHLKYLLQPFRMARIPIVNYPSYSKVMNDLNSVAKSSVILTGLNIPPGEIIRGKEFLRSLKLVGLQLITDLRDSGIQVPIIALSDQFYFNRAAKRLSELKIPFIDINLGLKYIEKKVCENLSWKYLIEDSPSRKK